MSRLLPAPDGTSGLFVRLAWWAAILAGSLAAMWLVDRLTKRLAPLAALCDMAVLFPGRAPSRLAVARRAGDVRQLRSAVGNADGVGTAATQSSAPADAAERILALAGALRAHDRHTRGHSERVRVYTDLIAAEMRLPTASVDRLRWAALLHDIGKLAVPAATLNKAAKLSSAEWDAMRSHPTQGARLAGALLPWLGEWGLAIAEHHERFDGTGYPAGLSGRDISLAGRVVAVADAFEVMTAPRAYKRAMTRQRALEELVRGSGSQFDPDVVRAFLRISAPKLRWAMGPTSWLVGTPFLGAAPSLTGAGVAAQAAISATSVAVAGVTGLAAPARPATSPPATRPTPAPTALQAPRPQTHPAQPGRSPRSAAPTTRPSAATTVSTPTVAAPAPATPMPGQSNASGQSIAPGRSNAPGQLSVSSAPAATPTAGRGVPTSPTAPTQGKHGNRGG
ncbi:MAG TPA: HD domain-containing phosphohydrolase [Acidothermaceae bacterium]